MSYKLEQPYTVAERNNFIVEHNHRNGLELHFVIENEQEEIIYALEKNELWNNEAQEPYINPKYNEEQLIQAKQLKMQENTDKCHKKLTEGTFTININNNIISYFYNDSTQNNLNSAALGFLSGVITQKEWTDEDGNTVYLSEENVAQMLLTLENYANPVWAKWGEYKILTDNASTIQEVEAIYINYDICEEENGV